MACTLQRSAGRGALSGPGTGSPCLLGDVAAETVCTYFWLPCPEIDFLCLQVRTYATRMYHRTPPQGYTLIAACPACRCTHRFVLLSESDLPLYDPLTFYKQLMSEAKSRVNACAYPAAEAYAKSSMWRWTPPMQVATASKLSSSRQSLAHAAVGGDELGARPSWQLHPNGELGEGVLWRVGDRNSPQSCMLFQPMPVVSKPGLSYAVQLELLAQEQPVVHAHPEPCGGHA